MRLFRQRAFGQWDGVFERMAEELGRALTADGDAGPLQLPVSPGELIDRLQILEIRIKKVADKEKILRLRTEAVRLKKLRDQALPKSKTLTALMTKLKAVNQSLWQMKADIRACAKREDYGPRFIELARSICEINDERAALKTYINELLGHDGSVEKLYQTE